jgi:ribosomal protein L21E
VFEVKNMSHDEGKFGKVEAENVKEILSVVSSEIPAMIKSILSSVFSEEAGRNMGKAAAAYYKELKDGGLPEPVAVKMTEEYMRTFTSLGDMLRSAGKGGWGHHEGDEISKEIHKRFHGKTGKRISEEE